MIRFQLFPRLWSEELCPYVCYLWTADEASRGWLATGAPHLWLQVLLQCQDESFGTLLYSCLQGEQNRKHLREVDAIAVSEFPETKGSLS